MLYLIYVYYICIFYFIYFILWISSHHAAWVYYLLRQHVSNACISETFLIHVRCLNLLSNMVWIRFWGVGIAYKLKVLLYLIYMYTIYVYYICILYTCKQLIEAFTITNICRNVHKLSESADSVMFVHHNYWWTNMTESAPSEN